MQRVLSGVKRPQAPSDPDAPATQDELRTLRRWVVVAGVWAVTATAVALIALLDDSGRAAERRANQTAERIAAAESRLDRRIGQLDSRLRRLPTSAQVEAVRSQVTQAKRSADGTAGEVSRLEDRVTTLEGDAEAPPDDSGGSDGPSLRDLFP